VKAPGTMTMVGLGVDMAGWCGWVFDVDGYCE